MKTKNPTTDLLSLFPSEMRQALIAEGLSARIRAIFSKHANSTIGRLFDALSGDPHWDAMRGLPVDTITRTEVEVPAPTGGLPCRHAKCRSVAGADGKFCVAHEGLSYKQKRRYNLRFEGKKPNKRPGRPRGSVKLSASDVLARSMRGKDA